jgi:hypothetical protein
MRAFGSAGLSVKPRRIFRRAAPCPWDGWLATLALGAAAAPLGVPTSALAQEGLRLDSTIVGGVLHPTPKRAIGWTVTTIDVDDVSRSVPVATSQELLAGRVPGLRFTRLTGNLGAGSPMTLRGAGSFDISRTQPLVYVDGVRVNGDPRAGPELSSGRSVSVIDDFNLEEVASIEVLKGPAATTLYGTEASAGVVHLRTKRGIESSPEVSVQVRLGVNYMPDPAGRLGTQWTCPADAVPGPVECQTESGLRTYNMYDEANEYIRRGYFEWPTDNLFQDGASRSYDLSVRGGSPSVRYFLSANLEDENGVVWYNTDEAFRLRANVGVTLSNQFDVDLAAGYVEGDTRFMNAVPEEGGVWQDLVWSNGYYLDRITPFGTVGSDPRLGGFQQHLPSDVARVEVTRDYARFTGSARLRFTSPEIRLAGVGVSLDSRLILGVDRGRDVNQAIFRLHDDATPASVSAYCGVRIACAPSSWSAVYGETQVGQLTHERPVSSVYTVDYGLTADVDAGDSWGSATSFGVQYVEDRRERLVTSGQGFTSPLARSLNQIEGLATTSELLETKSVGLYVQEEVSYANRIFLTGALRFDDHSTFGRDTPRQTYPRLSASWVASDEPFWGLESVDVLRLRAAWGKAGRAPRPLSNQALFVPSPGLDGQSGARPSQPGNPAVGPEVSTELEMGFDAALFDDRLWGGLTLYGRKDERLLLALPAAVSGGFPGVVEQNVGRIDSWGWEVSLGARLYEGPSTAVRVDLFADHVNNEIMALDRGSGMPSVAIGLPYPNQLTEDYVVSAQFDAAGDLSNGFGERISALCDDGVSLAPDPGVPDAAKYGRVRGGAALPCGTIPDRNLFVGPAFATHSFAIAPTVSLLGRSFQLFLLAEGQYGRWAEAEDKEWGHINNNSKLSRLEDDPAWMYGEQIGDETRRSLIDADFWRLREVGVRYSVPATWAARARADRASVSLSARNLWTIWQAQGDLNGLPVSDPEYGAPTLDGDRNFWETPAFASVDLTLRVVF